VLPYTHPLTVAARLGVEVGDLRREYAHDHVASVRAVHAAIKADRRRRAEALRTPVEPAIEYPPKRGAA